MRAWLLALSVVGLQACASKPFSPEGYACGSRCLEGYECHPGKGICVHALKRGCDDASAVCAAAIQSGSACDLEGSFVPCSAVVDDCSAGCRTCENKSWSACAPPVCASGRSCTTYHLDGDRDGFGDPDDFLCLCDPLGNYDSTRATDCDDASPSCAGDCATDADDDSIPDCRDKLIGCADETADVDRDGVIDCLDACIDADGDEYGRDGPNGVCANIGNDCDDGNEAIHPGALESCNNGRDDDCNPGTPDIFDADRDLAMCNVDCDDADPARSPNFAEVACSEVDEDCNPQTPDRVDGDGDDVACHLDCNDGDPRLSPLNPELGCNGIDDDCNPTTLDTEQDADDDKVLCSSDCDDQDPNVAPSKTEIPCNGKDDDCDPATPDERDLDGDGFYCSDDCAQNDPHTYPGAAERESTSACMTDADGDGYGDANAHEMVASGSDCVDSDSRTFPGVARFEPNSTACMTDRDGDGFGASRPAVGVTPGGDCDDSDPACGNTSCGGCYYMTGTVVDSGTNQARITLSLNPADADQAGNITCVAAPIVITRFPPGGFLWSEGNLKQSTWGDGQNTYTCLGRTDSSYLMSKSTSNLRLFYDISQIPNAEVTYTIGWRSSTEGSLELRACCGFRCELEVAPEYELRASHSAAEDNGQCKTVTTKLSTNSTCDAYKLGFENTSSTSDAVMIDDVEFAWRPSVTAAEPVDEQPGSYTVTVSGRGRGANATVTCTWNNGVAPSFSLPLAVELD